MEADKIILIFVIGILIAVNYDLIRLYDYISYKLYEGKKKAPRETSYNR